MPRKRKPRIIRRKIISTADTDEQGYIRRELTNLVRADSFPRGKWPTKGLRKLRVRLITLWNEAFGSARRGEPPRIGSDNDAQKKERAERREKTAQQRFLTELYDAECTYRRLAQLPAEYKRLKKWQRYVEGVLNNVWKAISLSREVRLESSRHWLEKAIVRTGVFRWQLQKFPGKYRVDIAREVAECVTRNQDTFLVYHLEEQAHIGHRLDELDQPNMKSYIGTNPQRGRRSRRAFQEFEAEAKRILRCYTGVTRPTELDDLFAKVCRYFGLPSQQ